MLSMINSTTLSLLHLNEKDQHCKQILNVGSLKTVTRLSNLHDHFCVCFLDRFSYAIEMKADPFVQSRFSKK